MRKKLPVAVTGVVGILMIVDYFLKVKAINTFSATLRAWGVIVSTCALGLGAVNLLMVHSKQLRTPTKSRNFFSLTLILSMMVTMLLGLVWGKSGRPFTFVYDSVIQPVNTAVFSMLAFFLGSASYRAFRARNVEASILLVVAIVVLLGQIPAGQALLPTMGKASTWVMNVLNLAGQRGLIVASGIAFIGFSLRVILGIERNHLGGGD
jgi:hypothetical protein